MVKLTKKQVVQNAGYVNIKALCKDNSDMLVNGKAPSKKQIMKVLGV